MDRDLGADERHVLDVLLSRDFPGRDELREQARSARVTGLSCVCGCPSVDLAVDRSAAAAPTSGMVVDGVGLDASGQPVGALLFVSDDAYLSELEITGSPTPTAGQRRRRSNWRSVRKWVVAWGRLRDDLAERAPGDPLS